MSAALRDIRHLWREKAVFQIAFSYLALLAALALALPVLPLPYGPNELDLQQVFQPPFQWPDYSSEKPAHVFGTDGLGRDVLANMLYGARTAFFISVPVMLLASVIGLALGASAGYFGDSRLKVTRAGIVAGIFSFVILCYYGLYLPLTLASLSAGSKSIGISIACMIAGVLLSLGVLLPLLKRWRFFAKAVAFPLDQLVLRLIEGFTSVPKLLLILALASFMPPSVLLFSAILVFTYWTGAARLARAEMLRVRQLPYFEAAQSIGLTQAQLLFRHALPNIAGPVIVSFAFGLAGLLALESTLSFLGIGVPTTLASWGRTIAGIRSNTSAWWLVVFPGAFLAVTVLALQVCSHYFMVSLQKKKQA